MSSHPDADAFMRSYLRTPHDTTARLVFADWLEETGKPWNVAWAYYIRVMADAGRHPPRSDDRRRLEREAAGYARKIRARLTIPAALFVGYPKSLLQLLPGPNITVRLQGFTPTAAALACVVRPMAELYRLCPLDRQGSTLLVATSVPHFRPAADDLENLLALRIVWVAASDASIRAASAACPWWTGGLVGDLVG